MDRTDRDTDEAITPAEMTKRMGDRQAASAGPGAPETVEPTQGHDDDGPSGPPQRDLGKKG
jgi:hypothetical protein